MNEISLETALSLSIIIAVVFVVVASILLILKKLNFTIKGKVKGNEIEVGTNNKSQSSSITSQERSLQIVQFISATNQLYINFYDKKKEIEEQKKFRQIQTVKNSCSKYRDLFIEQYSKSTKTGAGNTFYLTYFLDKELEKFTETFLRTIEKNHLLNKTGDNFEDTLDIDFENAYDDLEKQISLAQSYFKLDGNSLLTVSSSLQKTFKEDLKNAIQSILRDSIDRQIEINDAYTEYQNVLKDLAQKYFPEIESEELVLKGVRI